MGELNAGPEHAAKLADELVGQTSDFQAAILEDGEVTQAEFDQAVAAALSCMEDRGIDPDAEISADGRGVSFGSSSDSKNSDELQAIITACQAEFYDEVGIVWSVAQTPTDPAQRQRDLEAFRRCLSDAGVDVPAELTAESLSKALGTNMTDDADDEAEDRQPESAREVQACKDQYGYLLE